MVRAGEPAKADRVRCFPIGSACGTGYISAQDCLHRVSLLYKLNSIHNWNLEKTSAWLNLFRGRIQGSILFIRNDAAKGKGHYL